MQKQNDNCILYSAYQVKKKREWEKKQLKSYHAPNLKRKWSNLDIIKIVFYLRDLTLTVVHHADLPTKCISFQQGYKGTKGRRRQGSTKYRQIYIEREKPAFGVLDPDPDPT